MRIIFLSKKKEEKHMRTVQRLVHAAVVDYDFELAKDGVKLMSDVFGLRGLNFGKAMCEKRINELEDKLKGIESEG